MGFSKGIKIQNEVARIPMRATFFAITGILLAAILIFFGLRWIVINPAISPELKVSILFGSAFVSFILGFSAITLIVRRLKKTGTRKMPVWQILILAYLVTMLALFAMVFAYIGNPPEKFLNSIISFFLWVSRIPLLWIIQVSVLAWLMCRSRHPDGSKKEKIAFRVLLEQEAAGWKNGILSDQFVIALLFGLGSWLAARFLISIESNWLPGQFLFEAPADRAVFNPLFWLTALIGITLGPWAEEVFFQEHLGKYPKDKSGWFLSSLAPALLFGVLQFRPLLFLPAVMLGLGTGWLRSQHGIKPAVLAHAFFNFLTILLAWTQVI